MARAEPKICPPNSMKDPKRQEEIIKEIAESWARHPELRFGQWFHHCLYGEDPFYLEDENLLTILRTRKK